MSGCLGNRRSRSLLFLGVLTFLTASCNGQTSDLPPHAEALLIVDTDLPVPQLASRLRVDLYTEDGKWFESRDVGRPDPRDWPASFSVFSDDDTRERRVLVRLRVHPEGITRDYKGERYEPRTPYVAPRVASSLADLCANAPELPLNGQLTLRAGAAKLTDVIASDRCLVPAASGSVAARITIPTRGRYRFWVSNAVSYNTYATLSLRTSCEDPSSQIICQNEPRGGGVFSPGHFPRFDADLDAGSYFLLTTGETHGWTADITLEAAPTDVPIPISDPLTSTTPFEPNAPRLERLGSTTTNDDVAVVGRDGSKPAPKIDATPRSEPLPSATVDRLLVLRLVPGVRGRVRVTLRGACAGTMARLGADPHRPDPKTAESCTDTEDERQHLEDTPIENDNLTRPYDTLQGTFGRGESCPAPPEALLPSASSTASFDERVACIPGGAFLFGSRLLTGTSATEGATSPERIAVIPRFWMDRYEVTNERLRAAIARGGFSVDDRDIYVNDGPYGRENITEGNGNVPFDGWCTWSSQPKGREDLAVSCVNWSLARAFCQAEGGDLPTEAEWEYAAGAAARPSKTFYPWGESRPDCDGVITDRSPFVERPQSCGGSSALPVTAGLLDATPSGVFGLGGGVLEWTLDSGRSFGGSCWSAARLTSPRCWEDDAPMHAARGASWATSLTMLSERMLIPSAAAAHGVERTLSAIPALGFRCVYRERPR